MDKQDCVIAGGGPAGMMLGLCLARAGLQVTVLEKHGDFLRDFRGDTVHPSTQRVLDELGLGEAFRALPQAHMQRVGFPQPDGSEAVLADFTRMQPPYNFVALVPQWDLLQLLASAAQKEPGFTLLMDTEATWTTTDDAGTVTGVSYRTASGTSGEIAATLTVACDGRRSVLRDAAGLQPKEYSVSFDAWWFRLDNPPVPQGAGQSADSSSGLNAGLGHGCVIISLPRPGYSQVAYLDAKGATARLKRDGVQALRERIATVMPRFADQVASIESIDSLSHLDVRLDRLTRWHRPGFLAIGDAAHAMSPAGGIGINLAVQDALVAARHLAPALKRGAVPEKVLAAIQRRRWLPIVIPQLLQRIIHHQVFDKVVRDRKPAPAVGNFWPLKRFPQLRKVPAAVVGWGVFPQHAPRYARRCAPQVR